MFYTYKINYWNEFEETNEDIWGFVEGESIIEVINKLVFQYGDKNIEELTLTPFSPDSILEFRGKNIPLYHSVIARLEKEVFW